jgi:peptidoglycan/LPS O-acetylase OafA/YrhL
MLASLPNTKLATVPLLHQTLAFIAPSFLTKLESPPIPRPTDFLDGMRGFACLAVYISHCVPPFFPNGRIGFWSNHGQKNDNHIAQLPFLRLVYSGTSMVLIFFVLSGFSITLKPLKLARQGASDSLYDNLVSATFRRTGRLYFPCMALMLCVLVLNFLGCFRYSEDELKTWPFLVDQVPAGLRQENDRLWRFLYAIWQWADPVLQPLHISERDQQLTIHS